MQALAPKVPVIEVEGEGLHALLEKRVLLLCANYFYVGKLVGVNEKYVKLENPSVVYETGPWSDARYKDVQPMGVQFGYVQLTAIEFFSESK